MNILLTGATGYIGSAWLGAPSSQVTKIVAFVRERHTATLTSPTSSLAIEIREGNIPSTEPESLLEGIDVVIHLAAHTPSRGTNNPAVFEEDRLWTKKLGAACLKHGVKLIFVSTSSIYAGQNGLSLPEDTPLIDPPSAYPASKYATEEDLRALVKEGLQLAILRFGSVFGAAPAVNWERAVNGFVKQAVAGEPIVVWRVAMEQMRPYTHIDDCVAAINFVIERNLFSGDVYNIVSENTTVQAIVAEIKTQISTATTSLVDDARMNELSFGMDDTKIRNIGFIPHGTLALGIASLVATHNQRVI